MPPVGGYTPAIRFNNVVFPDPEGPIIPILDLGLISIDIFFNAFTSPKLLEIFAKEYFPRTVE